MKWAEISELSIVGQSKKMLKYYDGIKYRMSHNPIFLYNYAAELNYNGHYKESLEFVKQCAGMWNDYDVQILLANNYTYSNDKDGAIQSFEEAYNMIPCRFEPLYGILSIYCERNDTVNVIQTANEILEKPIKVHSERLSQIIAYANKANDYFLMIDYRKLQSFCNAIMALCL